MYDRATEATRAKNMYLGPLSTVTDAEEVGVMLVWEGSDIVALDSRGAIQRIWNLQFCQPRSWIEERLKAQMIRPRTLIWVKGHTGIEGNEQADGKAREVEMGIRMARPGIATPAGIRQAYPIQAKAPPHLSWPTRAIKGLVYIVTDKGPQRQWMKEIGKTDEPLTRCVCDAWTPQNATHLQRCPW